MDLQAMRCGKGHVRQDVGLVLVHERTDLREALSELIGDRTLRSRWRGLETWAGSQCWDTRSRKVEQQGIQTSTYTNAPVLAPTVDCGVALRSLEGAAFARRTPTPDVLAIRSQRANGYRRSPHPAFPGENQR